MIDFHLLNSQTSGAVLTPGDAGYAEQLLGFNLAWVHTPDVVVAATGIDDVVAAVRFAADAGLHVTVLATGHGAHEAITSGMVISTRDLDSVSVDAEACLATIGGGARWGAVVAEASPLGLAPITGSSADVGVVGYLLGGGVGPLARSHGFSSDYVESFTLVTPLAEVITVSADEHPELFWAMRGGKSGFGVVVEVVVRLVELATLYGGSLIFAENDIAPVLHGWIDYTKTADERVTTSVAIVHFPPVDEVPEIFRGRTLLMLRFAFPGDAAEGERLAAPLRALAPAMIDALAAMPASAIATIHNDPSDPAPAWTSGAFLSDIDGAFADAMLAHVGYGVETPLMVTEVRHIGGATHTDAVGGSAVGGRDANYTLNVIGAPVPALFEHVLPGAFAGLDADIARYIAPVTNINFFAGGTLEQFTNSWPAATFERLDTIRAAEDPAHRFAYGPARG